MKKVTKGRFTSYHHEPETDGRVFYVTDLHGQYHLLKQALRLLKFRSTPPPNVKPDYVFSCGDMCDRGLASLDVLMLFRDHPRFESIMGNHERIMHLGCKTPPYESADYPDQLLPNHQEYFWKSNGGTWKDKHDYHVVAKVAEWAVNLPIAAEINIGNHKIGMTHASILPVPNVITTPKSEWFNTRSIDWNITKEACIDMGNPIEPSDLDSATEQVITYLAAPFMNNILFNVDGLDACLHGHMITPSKPKVLDNRIYFDNDSVNADALIEQSCLTILEYKPSKDALLGLFDVHQFHQHSRGLVDFK